MRALLLVKLFFILNFSIFSLSSLWAQFNPSAIPNLKAWYRGDSLITLAGSVVSQWGDMSGNGYNAVQASNANRPSVANVGLLNNKKVVRFNGTSNFLTVDPFNQSQPITVFAIWNTSAPVGTNQFLYDGIDANNRGAVLYYNTPNNIIMHGSAPNIQYSAVALPNRYLLTSALYNNGQPSELYEGGILKVRGVTGTNVLTGLIIGRLFTANYYLKGDIAELIFFDRALDSTERYQVEQYLRNRYAPPVSLGADTTISTNTFCPYTLSAQKDWFTAYQWSTGATTPSISVTKTGTYSVTATDIFGYKSVDTIQINRPAYDSLRLTPLSRTVCYGDSTQLNIPLPTSQFSFNWSNGKMDSSIYIGSEGEYSVSVTDAFSCSAISDTVLISIDSFALKASLGNDTTLCVGNLIGLQNGAQQGLSYLWGDLSTQPTLSVSISGDYILNVTDVNACTLYDTIHVNIAGVAPTVSFTADSACFGSPTSFTSSISPTNIDSVFWNFGNGLTSNVQNPNVILTNYGNTNVELTAYDGICITTISAPAFVYQNPSTSILSEDSFCINTSALFDNQTLVSQGQNIIAYEWNVVGGGTYTTPNFATSFAVSGNYDITLKVTSNKQCTDSVNKKIIVVPPMALPSIPSLIAPVNFQSTTYTINSFSWNTSNHAKRYQLQISTDTSFTTLLADTATKNTSLNIDLPINANPYYWRVIAFNLCGDSAVSLSRSFRVFNPSTIPNLKAWYRGDSLITLAGSVVSQWGDMSGNGYNAVQASNANRPSVANVGLLNNKKLVRFNGTSNFLTVDPFNQSQPITVFAIWNTSAPVGTNQFLYDGIDANNRGAVLYYNTPNNIIMHGSAPNIQYSAVALPNRYLLTSALYNNGQPSELYEGGVLKVRGVTGTNVLTGLIIGRLYSGNYYLKGDIAELIFFDRALDSTERYQVEQYLRNRYAPPVNLGPDISFAYGACDTTLKIQEHFAKVLWSTGDTDVYSIKVHQSGKYWVRATDIFGYVSSDTVEVEVPYSDWKLNLTNDTIICEGNTITLNYTLSGAPYSMEWSTGDIGVNQININQAGEYFVRISDTIGCVLTSDTIRVDIDSLEYFSVLDDDTLSCINYTLGLNVYDYPYQNYHWSTGGTNDTIKIPSSGWFYVTVHDVNGCSTRDSILVQTRGTAPVVDFTFQDICFGDTTIFTNQSTATSPENIVQWVWDMGSNDTLSNQNPIKYFPLVGSYNVQLTAVTDSACFAQKTKTLTIGARPNPLVNYNITCANTSTLISDASTIVAGDTITTWLWSLPDGSIYTTKNLTYKFPSVGTFPVKLSVGSAKGCVDSTQTLVEVFPPINPDFTFDNQCAGSPTIFKDATESQAVTKRVWKLSNAFGVINDSLQFRKTYYAADTFEVSLEVSNAIGCKDTVRKNVVIYPAPIADFIDSAACAGGNILLHESSVSLDSIVRYQWKFGNAVSIHPAPTFALPDSGQVVISLKVTTSKACTDSIEKILTIINYPKANFAFEPLFGEAPLNVEMRNLSSNAQSYFWNFGNGTSSTDENPNVLYTSNDTFNIQLTAFNELGCADSTSKKIVIIHTEADIELLSVNTQKTLLPDGNFSVSIIARFANVGTQPITQAQLLATIDRGNTIVDDWAGFLYPGEILVHTFSSSFYMLRSAETQFVCVDAIYVNKGVEKNTENNRNCISVDNKAVLTKLYPNPATGKIYLDLIMPDTEDFNFEISNEMGQKLLANETYKAARGYNRVEFDVRTYLPGVYILKIMHRDNVEIQKFRVGR